MANLKAALVGYGIMGRNHARVLAGIEGVDFACVVDGQVPAEAVPSGMPLHRELSAAVDQGVDMAIVAVPTAFHEQVGLELAAAGVHALIEKPIANDHEEGRRLVDAFASAGLVGAVGHIERYNPALQELRRRLDEDELGTIYQISTRRQSNFPARIADVGVVKDLGTHDIDLTSWLAQAPYESIFGQTSKQAGRDHEDLVSATGTLQGGIIVNHVVNWLSPFKERTTVVSGERGTFVADTVTADLTFYANGTLQTEWEQMAAFRGMSEGDVTRYAIAKREPLRVEHENFRDAILGKETDIVTLEDGLRTLRVAEGVLESARTGKVVAFP